MVTVWSYVAWLILWNYLQNSLCLKISIFSLWKSTKHRKRKGNYQFLCLSATQGQNRLWRQSTKLGTIVISKIKLDEKKLSKTYRKEKQLRKDRKVEIHRGNIEWLIMRQLDLNTEIGSWNIVLQVKLKWLSCRQVGRLIHQIVSRIRSLL